MSQTAELEACRHEKRCLEQSQRAAETDMFEEERAALIDQLNELQRSNNKTSREYDKALRQVKDRVVAVHHYFFGQTPCIEACSLTHSKNPTDCERLLEATHAHLDSLVELTDRSKEKLAAGTEELLSELDSRVNDSMRLLSTKLRLADSKVEKLSSLTLSTLSTLAAKNAKLRHSVDCLVEEKALRLEAQKRLEAEATRQAQSQARLLSIEAVMRGVVQACEGVSAVYSKLLQQAAGPAAAGDPDARKIEDGRAALARYMHVSAMERLGEVRSLASELLVRSGSPRASASGSYK